MTRQVAIGAIVAFALTVLGLSLWQGGGSSPTATPAPVPAGAAAPVVAPAGPKEQHAAQLGVEIRQTTTIGPRLLKTLALDAPADAGSAPAPTP